MSKGNFYSLTSEWGMEEMEREEVEKEEKWGFLLSGLPLDEVVVF